jgi:Calcineurin-like phosphoesterase
MISLLPRQCRCLRCLAPLLVVLPLAAAQSPAQTNALQLASFSFITAGDMRNFVGPAPAGQRYFDGLCQAAARVGAGEFMISPWDRDPPAPIRAIIDRYLRTNYLWYPVVGNHDADNSKDMGWFHHWAEAGIPHLARRGPPGAESTIFSFNFNNSHFVVVDEYYDGRSDAVGNGDVPEAALKWLAEDLAATKQPLLWVTGHKPLESLPDMDTGQMRHKGDSISANPAHRTRFLQLRTDHHVRAYICGHAHNASIAKVEGLWQLDSGHARGAGDTGAPSTFLKVHVSGQQAWVDVYRSDANGVEYHLARTQELN